MLSDILHMSAFYILIGIGGAIVQGICVSHTCNILAWHAQECFSL